MSEMLPDPTDPSLWFIGSASEPGLGAQVGDATLVNVHSESTCAGRACVVHHPSEHHMRRWPLNFRGDKAQMERTCPHGVGHPDPDDLAWHVSQGRTSMGVHGCHLDETGRPCCAER